MGHQPVVAVRQPADTADAGCVGLPTMTLAPYSQRPEAPPLGTPANNGRNASDAILAIATSLIGL